MRTTMRGRRWCAALAVAGTLGVTAVAGGLAAAQEDKACTRGDAEKVTQVASSWPCQDA